MGIRLVELYVKGKTRKLIKLRKGDLTYDQFLNQLLKNQFISVDHPTHGAPITLVDFLCKNKD